MCAQPLELERTSSASIGPSELNAAGYSANSARK